MSVFEAVILGIVQGIGEFLPISSSGHMLLGRILFGLETDTPAMKMFDVLLHVGTLLPIVIVFWKDWIDLFAHPVKNKTLLRLFISCLPIPVFYIGAKLLFPDVDGFAVFDSGWFLGVSFLITALMLIITDLVARKGATKKEVGAGTAFFMGIFQAVGMIPGVSRSGSTITGGVLAGTDKKTAARFSFMMSAPAVFGSLLIEGKDALETDVLAQIEWTPTIIGLIVAAIVGFLAIRFMLKLINRIPLGWFALYLAIIGIAFLACQMAGVSSFPAFAVPAGAVG